MKQFAKEAADILDQFDRATSFNPYSLYSWVSEAAEFVPVAGDAYGAFKLGSAISDARSKILALQKKLDAAEEAAKNAAKTLKKTPTAPASEVPLGVGSGRNTTPAFAAQPRGITPSAPKGIPKHQVPGIPGSPSTSPGAGWTWRGKPGEPIGGDKSAWFNPKTGETLHPDLSHGGKIGSHWDWRDPDGNFWRIFPDGRIEPRG